jgi:hypothetical protein
MLIELAAPTRTATLRRAYPLPWNTTATLGAATNAEYFYDYAGQDPVNGFDLSGLFVFLRIKIAGLCVGALCQLGPLNNEAAEPQREAFLPRPAGVYATKDYEWRPTDGGGGTAGRGEPSIEEEGKFGLNEFGGDDGRMLTAKLLIRRVRWHRHNT